MLSRFSIRWRLAIISSALTFVVLCAFAVVVGQLTTGKVRSSFGSETANAASELANRLSINTPPASVADIARTLEPDLDLFAASNKAAVRVFYTNPLTLLKTTRGSPDLGLPTRQGSAERRGYLVETRKALPALSGYRDVPNAVRFPVWIEYARPLAEVKNTIRGVRWFLTIGVFLGTLLAFLGGLALAKRSLRPITDLTATARDITRTGDADRQLPEPRAEDEVAELAQTLNEMLGALDRSQRATEGALERQRAFVADASHELRTPLTSVLANLELLVDELQGEEREAAQAALRSSRRMRRLVADLLLLARSDGGQERHVAPVDLGAIAVDAVGEAGALAGEHRLGVDAASGLIVDGARDELHRMVLNLVENAINHTPAGTTISVRVQPAEGDRVTVTVEDDGPGVPPDVRDRIFERFVRAGGDHGGSTGLGLAIVRAVAVAHGGTVVLEDAEPGARFVVALPRVAAPSATPEPVAAAHAGDGAGAQTSTTTGRTIGLRRRRS